jgi:hypothetical protein
MNNMNQENDRPAPAEVPPHLARVRKAVDREVRMKVVKLLINDGQLSAGYVGMVKVADVLTAFILDGALPEVTPT